jgi:hypothetical protein
LWREPYRNWSREIDVPAVWVCAPRTAAEVAEIATWAAGAGHRLQARGKAHSFAPLTTTGNDKAVLADTTRHLNEVELVRRAPSTVRAGAGVTMDELTGFLHRHGLALPALPAAGDLTLGGVLAVGAHGTGVPGSGGPAYGSLGELVTSLTAVVWDQAARRYVPRVFERDDPDFAHFLTHLGRAFVTEVTLSVEPDVWLRCVSTVTVSASEVIGPGLAELVDQEGRVEIWWFPYTDRTWVRTWSPRWQQGPSRPAVEPYNYPFLDRVPESLAELAARLVTGAPELAPHFSQAQHGVIVAGLAATGAGALAGPSRNVLLYARPSMLRLTAAGWAITMRRADLGQTAGRFAELFRGMLEDYRRQGLYPVNGMTDIRVTGLDRTMSLAACAPDPGNPQHDTTLWINVMTLPGTPGHTTFFTELERALFATFLPPLARTRVEWSKGWAYGSGGACCDPDMLSRVIPQTFGPAWSRAKHCLAEYDPARVFGSSLLEALL